MSLTTRTILAVTLALAAVSGAYAQATPVLEPTETAQTATAAATDTTVETATAPTSTAASEDKSGLDRYELRNQFTDLLYSHSYELRTLLVLEPALLNNEKFMASYPELENYLRQHPEIRSSPRYFVSRIAHPRDASALDNIFEMFGVIAGFSLAVFALAWVVRTIIEQKRWNRLNRTQTEVHTKILDRFNSSDELLAYIKTPAGTKFLESAPIPLQPERPRNSHNPATRIIWSIQLGVVIAATGLGGMLVGLRFEGETSHAMFALGAIGFCLGLGFIASAVVSIMLSRRLGVWQESGSGPARNPLDEPGLMR